jgi:PAS domain-containing protein
MGLFSRARAPLAKVVGESSKDMALVEQQLVRIAHLARTPDPELANAYFTTTDELLKFAHLGQSDARSLLARDATRVTSGDPSAIERSLMGYQQIGEESRKRLREAERFLAFQSRAAAWVLVFLGGAMVLLSSWVRGFLSRTWLSPIQELARVIHARSRGDARVRAAIGDFGDYEGCLERFNQILDAMEVAEARTQENAASEALVALLDQRKRPSVIVSSEGRFIAMNESALELFSSERGDEYRGLISRSESGAPGAVHVVDFVRGGYRLCELNLGDDAVVRSVASP